MRERDSERRSRVRGMLDRDQLLTAEDLANAALFSTQLSIPHTYM